MIVDRHQLDASASDPERHHSLARRAGRKLFARKHNELRRKRFDDFAGTTTHHSEPARKPSGLRPGTAGSGGTISHMAFALRWRSSKRPRLSWSVSQLFSRNLGLGLWATTQRRPSSHGPHAQSLSGLGVPLCRRPRAVSWTPLPAG